MNQEEIKEKLVQFCKELYLPENTQEINTQMELIKEDDLENYLITIQDDLKWTADRIDNLISELKTTEKQNKKP